MRPICRIVEIQRSDVDRLAEVVGDIQVMRIARRGAAENCVSFWQEIMRGGDRFRAIEINVAKISRRRAKLNADVLRSAVKVSRRILRIDANVLPAFAGRRFLSLKATWTGFQPRAI